jgi:hypothetical protein
MNIFFRVHLLGKEEKNNYCQNMRRALKYNRLAHYKAQKWLVYI